MATKKYLGAVGIAKLKELITAAFVSKSQGSANAGKVLGVDSGGDVAPAAAGVRMTKLWENASPTSNFAAQTITLDLSGYDGVLIRVTGGYGWQVYSEFYLATGADGYMSAPFVWMGYRNVTVTESGVAFDGGQRQSSYGSTSWSDNGGAAIPVTIWGIKE